MLNTTIGVKTAVCLTASVLMGATASAAVIYDNTEVFQNTASAEANGTEFGDVVVYTIVGSAESDPINNKISNESPVGQALLGKSKGTVVDVHVPAGIIQYEILDINL